MDSAATTATLLFTLQSVTLCRKGNIFLGRNRKRRIATMIADTTTTTTIMIVTSFILPAKNRLFLKSKNKKIDSKFFFKSERYLAFHYCIRRWMPLLEFGKLTLSHCSEDHQKWNPQYRSSPWRDNCCSQKSTLCHSMNCRLPSLLEGFPRE